MRIADHHAAPVCGHVAAKGPAIAAHAQFLGIGQGARASERGLACRRARRRGVGDCGGEGERACEQHLLFVQAQHVVVGDRADPGLAAAFGGDAIRPGVLEEAVVARDIAGHQVPCARGQRLGALAQRRDVDHRAEEHIRAEIIDLIEAEGGFRFGAEMARAFACHSGEFLGQQAQIVLGIGIGDPGAHPGPRLGLDMRDSVSGAGDGRFCAFACVGLGRLRKQ
jgi:hypothetical protein